MVRHWSEWRGCSVRGERTRLIGSAGPLAACDTANVPGRLAGLFEGEAGTLGVMSLNPKASSTQPTTRRDRDHAWLSPPELAKSSNSRSSVLKDSVPLLAAPSRPSCHVHDVEVRLDVDLREAVA